MNESFEELIKNHSILITVLSTVMSALATVVLVFITRNYAKTTKTIAGLNNDSTTILKQEFESNNRPFVFISDFNIDKNTLGLMLNLGNSGKLPAKIKVKTLEINFYNIPSTNLEAIDMSKMMEKRNYYVYPGQKNSFIGHPYDEKIFSRIKETDGFVLSVQLEYWQIGKPPDIKKNTTIAINFKTNKDSYEGIIHDIQTTSAN